MARNPNAAGKGPKVSSQGNKGPITGSWGLSKGSNKTTTKSAHAPQTVGSSPSKERGSWYLGKGKK